LDIAKSAARGKLLSNLRAGFLRNVEGKSQAAPETATASQLKLASCMSPARRSEKPR
jgi:hypothetical protein